jgi:hypothetical protein
LACAAGTRGWLSVLVIGQQRAGRLFLEQAQMVQETGRAPDLAGANKDGQQLFFADMTFTRRGAPRLTSDRRDPWKRREKNYLPSRPVPGSRRGLGAADVVRRR